MDVLAVQEDPEDPEGEQDRGQDQIMLDADAHQMPLPVGTFLISTDSSIVRALCLAGS